MWFVYMICVGFAYYSHIICILFAYYFLHTMYLIFAWCCKLFNICPETDPLFAVTVTKKKTETTVRLLKVPKLKLNKLLGAWQITPRTSPRNCFKWRRRFWWRFKLICLRNQTVCCRRSNFCKVCFVKSLNIFMNLIFIHV